jgi:putative DNA methylase
MATNNKLLLEFEKTVGAGEKAFVEVVDFSDPNRPKTCLEVDFPILPINQIAVIEGNAGKPIYQLSKWWARRRSSVFRSILLAAGMKAPPDPLHSARHVWDYYYKNHQNNKELNKLKVVDVFMGGGTTIIEGSRLGMQMIGIDLNPVAWFVVKNELAKTEPERVRALLDRIEREIKPELAAFYSCQCPRGHKQTWSASSESNTNDNLDLLGMSPEQRSKYNYIGPEIVYEFWVKHVPCQVAGCNHYTPVVSNPILASKSFVVDVQEDYKCKKCDSCFDVEFQDSRICPEARLVDYTSKPYAVLEKGAAFYSTCPNCKNRELHLFKKTGKRKVDCSVVIDSVWLKGQTVESDLEITENLDAWLRQRHKSLELIELRGEIPTDTISPYTSTKFSTTKGTVPRDGCFTCGSCGTEQSVLEAVKKSGKQAPFASAAIQGRCPQCAEEGQSYNGRFFSKPPVENFIFAKAEWSKRSNNDLADYWPKDEIQIGAEIGPHDVNGHHYKNWWMLFNARQLLVHARLLKTILSETHLPTKLTLIAAHQQYLRNQNMFCFYNRTADKLEPHYSKNEFHPKAMPLENSIFSKFGRGHWESCTERIFESLEWSKDPWERLPVKLLNVDEATKKGIGTASVTIRTKDPTGGNEEVYCRSSTDLSFLEKESIDLVVTDPPFGEIVQYAELSDFFYVWLKPALKELFPEYFTGAGSPKSLEVVTNSFRNPEQPELFYQRLLTDVWKETFRILKPGGLLAFTFHHDKDDPWIAVLQSLFDAGFYLEATYPIRSDETKGDGDFGSKKVEYDIIHVCRKRLSEPESISWPRLRRQILEDIRQLRSILELHSQQGLPSADLQVIKRGKALEYFSRHYGKVFIDVDREFTVKDALVGINQILAEEASGEGDLPPLNAEPMTRQFLGLFNGAVSLPRDQIQKFLKGTGVSHTDFDTRGWSYEDKKVVYQIEPLQYAKTWYGKARAKLTTDLDQALFLIGACFEGSGINALETLNNANLKPHPALESILEWYMKKSTSGDIRNAAIRAQTIFQSWKRNHVTETKQMELLLNG